MLALKYLKCAKEWKKMKTSSFSKASFCRWSVTRIPSSNTHGHRRRVRPMKKKNPNSKNPQAMKKSVSWRTVIPYGSCCGGTHRFMRSKAKAEIDF